MARKVLAGTDVLMRGKLSSGLLMMDGVRVASFGAFIDK
jgi:hypothetical protein